MSKNNDAQKVLFGKEDWLFLDNDTNHVIESIEGKRYCDKELVKRWKLELFRRINHAKANNYLYKFIIPPNKHCVYSKYLPDHIHISENRLVRLLQNNFPNDIIYPIELFKENIDQPLYFKTDTHWSKLAAVLLMNSIADDIGSKKIKFETSPIEVIGDLGGKLDPPISSQSVDVKLDCPDSQMIYGSGFGGTGRYTIMKGHDDSLPTAVFFGDSYLFSVRDIISAYFKKAYLFWSSVFDEKIIEKISPDIVFNCSIERFLCRIPALLSG